MKRFIVSSILYSSLSLFLLTTSTAVATDSGTPEKNWNCEKVLASAVELDEPGAQSKLKELESQAQGGFPLAIESSAAKMETTLGRPPNKVEVLIGVLQSLKIPFLFSVQGLPNNVYKETAFGFVLATKSAQFRSGQLYVDSILFDPSDF